MATIELSIAILAAPSQVWTYLADIRRRPEWMSGIDNLEAASESTRGVGAAFRMVSRGPFGIKLYDDFVCTKWDEDETLVMERRGSIKGKNAFYLVPIELGSRVQLKEELCMPLGLLGELVFHLLFRRHLRRTLSQDIWNLKALVEERQDKDGPVV